MSLELYQKDKIYALGTIQQIGDIFIWILETVVQILDNCSPNVALYEKRGQRPLTYMEFFMYGGGWMEWIGNICTKSTNAWTI